MTKEESIRINEIRWGRPAKTIDNVNWPEVQAYYDSPHSVRETISHFKLHSVLWKSAVDSNKIFPRTVEESIKIKKQKSGKKHSEETRKLLSEKRKKFLSENPDKHPWKRKGKHISEPCEHLKKIFKDRGVAFVEEYQPLIDAGRFFSIDIAIPDKKLGIEVNGNQHYNDDGSLKKYYKERYDLITGAGWNLHEIHYSLVYNEEFVDKLIESIKSKDVFVPFDYVNYVAEKIKKSNEKSRNPKSHHSDLKNSIYDWSKFSELTIAEIQKLTSYKQSSIYCFMNRNGFKYKKTPRQRKSKNFHDSLSKMGKPKEYQSTKRKFNPTKEDLSKLVWELPYIKIAENYGVSDIAVKKRVKLYSINTPPTGYWTRRNLGYSHEESLSPLPVSPKRSKILSDEKVKEIKQKFREGAKIKKISEEYGIGYGSAKAIKYGWTYKNIE